LVVRFYREVRAEFVVIDKGADPWTRSTLWLALLTQYQTP
jgi:hypothetical protein